jgi:hypothetical protein
MLRQRSKEVRHTGVEEESFIKNHVPCRDNRRLGRDPNAKNIGRIVANKVAKKGTLKELLIPQLFRLWDMGIGPAAIHS